jgi:phosphatidylethanolamine/phosphatidyl-N-methylethanolamine N-methyltransferase
MCLSSAVVDDRLPLLCDPIKKWRERTAHAATIGGMYMKTPRCDLLVFLGALLREPGVVGAIAPSSRSLGEVLAAVVPRDGHPTVVELGPGTGAVSTVISRRLPPEGRHLAVEVDLRLADHVERLHPQVTMLRGDAVELGKLLDAAGAPRVDAVVSGLPWSLFDEDRQRTILAHVCRALTPGGGFSTFTYLQATRLAGGRRFRALLDEYFDEVIVTRTVWRNVPPALVYICRRPTRRAESSL